VVDTETAGLDIVVWAGICLGCGTTLVTIGRMRVLEMTGTTAVIVTDVAVSVAVSVAELTYDRTGSSSTMAAGVAQSADANMTEPFCRQRWSMSSQSSADSRSASTPMHAGLRFSLSFIVNLALPVTGVIPS
jgi:hypothetical protein